MVGAVGASSERFFNFLSGFAALARGTGLPKSIPSISRPHRVPSKGVYESSALFVHVCAMECEL